MNKPSAKYRTGEEARVGDTVSVESAEGTIERIVMRIDHYGSPAPSLETSELPPALRLVSACSLVWRYELPKKQFDVDVVE